MHSTAHTPLHGTAEARIQAHNPALCERPQFRRSHIGWHELRCNRCYNCEVHKSQRDFSRLMTAAATGRLGPPHDAMQITMTTVRGTSYGRDQPAYHSEIVREDVRGFHNTVKKHVQRRRARRGYRSSTSSCMKFEPHPTGKHRRLHAHGHLPYGDVLYETTPLSDEETLDERWQKAQRTLDSQTTRVRGELQYLIRNTPGHDNLRYRSAWRRAYELLPARGKGHPPATVTRKRRKARRALQTCGLKDAATRRVIGLLHLEPTEGDVEDAWIWLTAKRHSIGSIHLIRKSGQDTARYMSELAGKHMDGIPRDDVPDVMRDVHRPLTKGQRQPRRFTFGPALFWPQQQMADMPYAVILTDQPRPPTDDLELMRAISAGGALFREERLIYRMDAAEKHAARFATANGDVDYWEDLRRKESRIRGRLLRARRRGLKAILKHQISNRLRPSWYIRELADDKYNRP